MKKKVNKTAEVEVFLEKFDHPLKEEVLTVREIIKGVNPAITEEIKWNAPSFSLNDYIVTFHLRPTQHVHLVFHNPHIAKIQSPLLEGDYVDRRMAYFKDMDDILAKRAELERVVHELIRLMETA